MERSFWILNDQPRRFSFMRQRFTQIIEIDDLRKSLGELLGSVEEFYINFYLKNETVKTEIV